MRTSRFGPVLSSPVASLIVRAPSGLFCVLCPVSRVLCPLLALSRGPISIAGAAACITYHTPPHPTACFLFTMLRRFQEGHVVRRRECANAHRYVYARRRLARPQSNHRVGERGGIKHNWYKYI